LIGREEGDEREPDKAGLPIREKILPLSTKKNAILTSRGVKQFKL
jgi:hypothetical protein